MGFFTKENSKREKKVTMDRARRGEDKKWSGPGRNGADRAWSGEDQKWGGPGRNGVDRAWSIEDKKWSGPARVSAACVEGNRKDHTFSSLLGSGPRCYPRKTTELSTQWASIYNGMDDDWKQYL